MVKVKIEAKGKLSGVCSESGTDISVKLQFSCEIPKGSLYADLGKVIYSVEKSGLGIVTSDVYDSCVKMLNTMSFDYLSNRYIKIYGCVNEGFELKISVKRG